MAERKEDVPKANRLVHAFFIVLGLLLLGAGYLQLPLSPREAQIALGVMRGVQLMVVGASAVVAGIGLDSRRAWAWWVGVIVLVLLMVRVATALATGYYGEGDYLAKILIAIAGVICLRALSILLWRRRAYTK